MSGSLFLEAVRVLAATYLIALAVAAVFGVHRALLTYPFQAAYASIRLIVLAATLGRVRLAQNVRRQRRRGARRLRSLRYALAERREARNDSEGGRHIRNEWVSGEEAILTGPQAPPASEQTSTLSQSGLFSEGPFSNLGEEENEEPPPLL